MPPMLSGQDTDALPAAVVRAVNLLWLRSIQARLAALGLPRQSFGYPARHFAETGHRFRKGCCADAQHARTPHLP